MHHKKRIAIIADSIDNQKGGVHVYTRELVKGLLLASPGDLEFLLLREKRDPHLQGMRQIVIPNIRIGLGLAAVRLFLIVPFILWWNRVDAVIEPAHFGPFNLPKRIKRVTVIHDLTPLLFPQYHRFHSQWLQRIFLKRILSKASLIVANSTYTADDIRRFFPFTRGKVASILLGYDPSMQRVEDTAVLKNLEITSPFWLAVGTIEPRKNLVRLLEAYRLFRESHDARVCMVIVGERGWKSEPFFEALEHHPFRADILLTGYVSQHQLTALYSLAIGLVYPSEYEGFGLPVLEAFACGCPVICSNVSSLPEVGGDTAWYVDPLDEKSIAGSMIQLAHLPDRDSIQLRMACLERAAAFGWDIHAREFIQRLKALWMGEAPSDQESIHSVPPH
ncbi:MAG: glycosyltransferase family 4 protein [Saprospiraceae bacterium]|nr:glycosyltransferase family 4 protein [Saprospiraceae bacterium]